MGHFLEQLSKRVGSSGLGFFFQPKMTNIGMINKEKNPVNGIFAFPHQKNSPVGRVLNGNFQWRKENFSKSSEQLQRGILKLTGQAFVNLWYLLLQVLGLAEIITSEQMSVFVRPKRDFAIALGIDFHKEMCLCCIL